MNYHILPVDDLKEHDESSKCNCNPRVHIYEDNMLIIHNSYDGRELKETDNDHFMESFKNFLEINKK